MSNLDWAKARDELTDAVKYLAKNGKKVGTASLYGACTNTINGMHKYNKSNSKFSTNNCGE